MEKIELYYIDSIETLARLFSFGPVVTKFLPIKALVNMGNHYLSCFQLYQDNDIDLLNEEVAQRSVKFERRQIDETNKQLEITCRGFDFLPKFFWEEAQFLEAINAFLNDERSSITLRISFYGIFGKNEIIWTKRNKEYFDSNIPSCGEPFNINSTMTIPREKDLAKLISQLSKAEKIAIQKRFSGDLNTLYKDSITRSLPRSNKKPTLDQLDKSPDLF